MERASNLLPGIATSLWLTLLLDITWPFALIAGLLLIRLYQHVYISVLRGLPQTFTFGEAAILVQGLVLFLLNASFRLWSDPKPASDFGQLNAIMQSALVSLLCACVLLALLRFLRQPLPFYLLMLLLLAAVTCAPVTQPLPLIALLQFMFKEQIRVSGACVIYEISVNSDPFLSSPPAVHHSVLSAARGPHLRHRQLAAGQLDAGEHADAQDIPLADRAGLCARPGLSVRLALHCHGHCSGHIRGAGAAASAADAAVCGHFSKGLRLLQGCQGCGPAGADALLPVDWLRAAHLADALPLRLPDGRPGESAAVAPIRRTLCGRRRHGRQRAGLQVRTQQVGQYEITHKSKCMLIIIRFNCRFQSLLGGHRGLCAVRAALGLAAAAGRSPGHEPGQMVRHAVCGAQHGFGGGLYRSGGQSGAAAGLLHNRWVSLSINVIYL